MRTLTLAPKASILIESMRDVGYLLETALADIIDNSITAEASTIHLVTEANSREAFIGILDDGTGMTEGELLAAMRVGSRSPVDRRDNSDLGRFGLGLKTASFSQCRRVTVVTRHNGTTSAARWDIDHVAETDEWSIQIPDAPHEIRLADRLGEQGTLVLWENLDRLMPAEWSEQARTEFVRRIDSAGTHLELVFHRFLYGELGQKKIRMFLNGRALVPFDPFHSGHPATLSGPIETIKVGDAEVIVQPFTLPHHQKVTPREWERYGGAEGYVKNQGFYVYRGRRLIIYGTWFGLARQMELTKLARIRIEMPNELDSAWKIDVKKASAQPPYQVRERLRRIIPELGATSRRVYTERGTRLTENNPFPLWSRFQNRNDITYGINNEHPLIMDFSSRLADELKPDFLRVIEIAGAALPLDALFADFGGDPHSVSGILTSDATLRYAVETIVERLSDGGYSKTDVVNMMRAAEPFRSSWPRTQEILDVLIPEDISDE